MWAEASGGEGQMLGNVSILSKPFRDKETEAGRRRATCTRLQVTKSTVKPGHR